MFRDNFNVTFSSFSQFVCGFVLLWTLTLISMDRHRCIVVPPYRSQLTPRRATVLTVLTWLIALAVFMPVPFWFHEQAVMGGTAVNVCTLVFPKNDTFKMSIVFTVSVVSLSCILPLSLFVYHYQRIFHKLNKTRRRIEHSVSHRSTAVHTASRNSLSPPTNGSTPQVRTRAYGIRLGLRVTIYDVPVVGTPWYTVTIIRHVPVRLGVKSSRTHSLVVCRDVRCLKNSFELGQLAVDRG